MKFAFSTDFVKTESFLELCNVTSEYEFSGFEVCGIDEEKAAHEDSIFHSNMLSNSKRKLVNRHIGIAAVTYPEYVNGATDSEVIVKYVEAAASVGTNVVLKIENDDFAALSAVLTPAVKKAEFLGVMLLIETSGIYANTEKI